DAADHGDHEGDGRDLSRAEGGDGAAWAEAGNAPANAEEGRARDQRQVDGALGRKVKAGFKGRGRALQGEAVAKEGDGQGRGHDKHQARVPVAGNIEEVQHFCRIGHARNGDAYAEDEADSGGGRQTQHQKPPGRWRMTNTVAKVVAMK